MTILAILGLLAQDADALVDAGNAFMEKKQYEQALAKYEAALKKDPKHTDALYNGGLAAYLAGRFKRAAELWEGSRKLDPGDLKVLAKLVQAWQALGDSKKRDAARKELFQRRAALPEEERRKEARYCREQFAAGPEGAKEQVMVFEYYELAGPRAVRYQFSVVQDGEEVRRYSLGSYDLTTEYARASGQIGKDERMFHLDGYSGDGRHHQTYGLFRKEPTYEETRAMVVEILEKKRKPSSIIQ